MIFTGVFVFVIEKEIVKLNKNRYINTKFWSDNFVSELDPLERYLFLYFLTNEHTNIAGVYELPIRTMAFETGLDKEMLEKMMPRFDGKIYYIDGWIYIKNFRKHQSANSETVKIGIKNVIDSLPKNILAKIKDICIGDTQGSDRVCKGYHILEPKLELELEQELEQGADRVYFDQFWNEYPRKIAKQTALKSFNRLNPSIKLSNLILKDLKYRKKTDEWLKNNGSFIPYPATYLNQKRWEDEDRGQEPIKKPYFRGDPMFKMNGAWKVKMDGIFKEYAGTEEQIEWK